MTNYHSYLLITDRISGHSIINRISMLYQLQQHSIRRRRMNERHQTTARADTRRLINQAHAALLQTSEHRTNVINTHGDVMNARATLFNKFCDGRIIARRLKKLNSRFTHRQHRHPHALLFDNLSMHDLKPQRITPERKRIIKRACGNSYVLDFHNQWSVVSGQWSVISFELLAIHRPP